MSSLSWDFPPPSSNPSVDDDEAEVDGLGPPNGASAHAGDDELLELLEREELERLGREQRAALAPEPAEEPDADDPDELDRAQLEALEREQLAAFERAQLEEPGVPGHDGLDLDLDASDRSEQEQLEELEREQLRMLEQLEHPPASPAAVQPPPPAPAPAPARPRPSRPAAAPTPAPQEPAPWFPSADAEARAAQFLAEASARQALAGEEEAPEPSIGHRELSEPARAARAIIEHRHRNLTEANALLGEARRVLAPIAYRGLSDRIYRRRKIILAIGEAVSLAVAFSAAFDVAPLEALLLSGAIALAFVIAGDLGGILRISAERSRLSAALEDDAVHLDPRYHHILYHDRQPWLSIIGGVTAGVFALATVSVGVLRAANQGSLGLAAGLGLLTVALAIAAGLSSWQHASIGSEIIEHLQREEEAAARRLKRAAAARVLRGPRAFGSFGGPALDLSPASPAGGVGDWSAPDMDWSAPDSPTAELRPNRPLRAGRSRRAAREKPARRERAGGSLVGAAAARGALFLATLPGKLRRSEPGGGKPAKAGRSSRGEDSAGVSDDDYSGPGPGAGGDSAGSLSDIQFRPPVIVPKKFG